MSVGICKLHLAMAPSFVGAFSPGRIVHAIDPANIMLSHPIKPVIATG